MKGSANNHLGVSQLATHLALDRMTAELKSRIQEWAEGSDAEVREALRWQLTAPSKLFRPVTVFACHRAVSGATISPKIVRSALALELFHNVTLIVDDLLDRSRFRRGKLTLHCRFGELHALMAAGYLAAGSFRLLASDAYGIRLLTELMQRLGVAECLQWRLRRQPLGVGDWRRIATEDTGVMFEVCARLGTRDDRLSSFGRLLGILYHGCDDVADVRGAKALGGGGHEDLRDGILTLPAALAIRDPRTAALFGHRAVGSGRALRQKFAASLPEAETYLDGVAAEAMREARGTARSPTILLRLVEHTRRLSR
ncbi:MAG: polyprenyl synthetase family protein [Candidatus Rokuibacteriota bacterium]